MKVLNIFFGIVALVLAAAVVYVFYMGIFSQPSEPQADLNEDSQRSGLALPVDPSFQRFMDGAESLKTDFEYAVKTLAALASDTSTDPYYRTSAANLVAQALSHTPQSEVAAALPNTGEAAQILATAADSKEAQRRLYEWSDSIEPNPVAKLGSLQWHMFELQNNAQLQANERSAYLNEIDTTLSEAEELFQQEARGQGRKSFADARTYHALRGDVYGFLFLTNGDVQDKDRAVDAYERALRLDPATGYGLWARYHLANFLRKSDGEAARERIEVLLDGVIATHAINPSITLFTILETQKDEMSVAHDDAVETAAFYQPFGDVLQSMGWTIPGSG